ncbi:MAG: HPr(Ser) kinase/phosphatase [Leptospiraceae bacterium]|nr:HPr(Ser) kinase/phosphatase [Leptospiraceae bacterium]
MASIPLRKLLAEFPQLGLTLLSGQAGLEQSIQTVDLNRPGLALAGYYKEFASNRIQVFGRGEYGYLCDCSNDQQCCFLDSFFQYSCPGMVFTHNNRPPISVLERSNQHGIPVLVTHLSTHKFTLMYSAIMDELLAPEIEVHGELMDVFGVGILLTGDSGIGKSETAVELIERGHRLVADDLIHIRCISETALFGFPNPMLGHNMELRGIGIVNVRDLFGTGAIRDRIRIDVSVQLLPWEQFQDTDRIATNHYRDILGVRIPELWIPVRPGRNLPVLIETAAINHRSQRMGFDAGSDLAQRQREQIRRNMLASRDYQPGENNA